jgi:hypothetical protein
MWKHRTRFLFLDRKPLPHGMLELLLEIVKGNRAVRHAAEMKEVVDSLYALRDISDTHILTIFLVSQTRQLVPTDLS